MYEHFEHTADLGLRVVADDLERLFEDAARGLMAMVVEETPIEGEPVEIRIEGRRHDWLLFDWLSELLFRIDSRGERLGNFAVRLDERGLTGRAVAEPLDADRHRLLHEVKAITYHGLSVEQTDEGWRAEVIVDI